MPLKTADYSLKNYPEVYEPSEDSFLFIDALESEIDFIKMKKPTTIVEVGCGSSVIIASLASALNNCSFFTTDINMNACKAALNTGILNNIPIESNCMDLLSNFRNDFFDIVLFNPPYVVTDSSELIGNGLNRAWAGGLDGREIIDLFIRMVPEKLSHSGVLYLLLLKENKPKEVIDLLSLRGFFHEIIQERKILGEYLCIVKFYK